MLDWYLWWLLDHMHMIQRHKDRNIIQSAAPGIFKTVWNRWQDVQLIEIKYIQYLFGLGLLFHSNIYKSKG